MKRQVIASIITMLFLASIGTSLVQAKKHKANRLVLSQGWDRWDEPLVMGEIIYSTKKLPHVNNFNVKVVLVGARPNTLYRIILFTFSTETPPSLSGTLAADDIAPPLYVYNINPLGATREGYTSNGFSEVWFGEFTTDGNGDGSYNIVTHISRGTYLAQFLLKTPMISAEDGVFRSGTHFYDFFELKIRK